MKHRISFVWIALLGVALLPRPAFAAFHLMEIEQVIGGVGGDTGAQAVQLKMRLAGQNLLAGNAQLVVRDAAGANPQILATFALPNPTSGACREILLTTTGFASKTTPAAVGDYTMSPIPPGYLAAGSLTFESLGGGATWWRLSWGDGSYTGAQTVATATNDNDGSTSPAFATPLPSTGVQAVQFTPACATQSTTNAADYALTTGAAVFKNNPGATFTVALPGPPIPGLPGVSRYLLPALLGLGVIAFAILRRRRTA